MKKELIFSGSGGQGLILAGILMAEAAVLYEGLEAVQDQAYGPEARGGECSSTVIISDKKIYSAQAEEPDIILCMSQQAFNKYAPRIKTGGIVLADPMFVEDKTALEQVECNLIFVPVTQLAIEETGKSMLANVTALGLIVGMSDTVSKQSIDKEIEQRVPAGTAAMNLKALYAGIAAAKTAL